MRGRPEPSPNSNKAASVAPALLIDTMKSIMGRLRVWSFCRNFASNFLVLQAQQPYHCLAQLSTRYFGVGFWNRMAVDEHLQLSLE